MLLISYSQSYEFKKIVHKKQYMSYILYITYIYKRYYISYKIIYNLYKINLYNFL